MFYDALKLLYNAIIIDRVVKNVILIQEKLRMDVKNDRKFPQNSNK